MTDTGVMTVREMIDYLKFKDRTIYRPASNGGIPVFKGGGSLRFRKGGFDRWIELNTTGPGRPGKRTMRKK